MKGLLAAVAFATATLFAAADKPAIRFTEVESPAAAAKAASASLATAADGMIWLTWLEPGLKEPALKFATFDPVGKKWSASHTIAAGAELYVGDSDFPQLAAGTNGHATALWYVKNQPSAETAHFHHGAGYHALTSSTSDGGQTWSAPALLSGESDSNEFCAITTLADGRVLATWLDGRAKKHGGTNQQLYARIVGAPGPDTLIEKQVCDCCHTTLTAFPDGTALLAFRDRSEEEVRDVRVTRFRGAEWDDARPLNSDDWRIKACPVNGPQLASDGGRVAAAWFTAADNDPRVLATYSPDAGGRFLLPLRLSETKPLGRVATGVLHDGAMLVTFVDVDGALWLRRVTPEFVAADAVKLAGGDQERIKGFPRIALVRDYDGGKEPALLVAAFAQENGRGVRTLLISVPEGDLLEAEKNCDCAPTADQLRGFPIRGSIVAAQPEAGSVRVQHFEVPGIFAEGTREFKVLPAVLAPAAQPGRQFLGRIEQRDGAWWLFDVRLIASAPK